MLKFNQFFTTIEERRILVIGDSMLDRYITGSVNRISPEAPVPVLEMKSMDVKLGGAANVALNLKGLGANVKLISSVGEDQAAEQMMTLLADQSLSGAGIVTMANRKTTVKTRVLGGSQHLLRIDEEEIHALNSTEESDVISVILEIIDSFQPELILIEDYNKALLSPNVISTLLELAHRKKIVVTVDPKFQNYFAFQGVQLFKPNLIEVRNAVPFSVGINQKDLARADAFMRDKLNYQLLAITLGEGGIYLNDGTAGEIFPTSKRNIVDVCGAGDAVISALSLGFLANLSKSDLATLGNSAGGLICEKVGVVALRKEDLKQELMHK